MAQATLLRLANTGESFKLFPNKINNNGSEIGKRSGME